MKVPVGGGTATTLTVRAGSPAHIAVDETSVYWTETAGGVLRVPLAGGTPSTVATSTGAWNIALDATNVYWTTNDGVMMAAKAGGTASRLSGQGPLFPTEGIAVDATNVYWGSNLMPPGLMTVPVQGGSQSVLYAETPPTAPGALAIDATSVYWSDMSNVVHAGPLRGGTASALATGQTNVVAIAVDDSSAYWLVNGNGMPGSVVRLTPK
jgi:hypothetical protein